MKDSTWWTYWELQDAIQYEFSKFYGEPSISAAIRSLRNNKVRKRLGLPLLDINVDPIESKKITGGRGWKFRLINTER